MVAKVQTVPQGLIKLLDLPGGGPAPSILPDTVQAVIDLTPRYLSRFLQVVSTASTPGLAALGAQVVLTVPQGECWDVLSANFTVAAAAAAVVPALEINALGAAVGFIPGTDTTRANPYEHTVIWTPGQPVTLSPGQTITGAVRSTPNSALTGIVRALVRVLPNT